MNWSESGYSKCLFLYFFLQMFVYIMTRLTLQACIFFILHSYFLSYIIFNWKTNYSICTLSTDRRGNEHNRL